MRTCAGCGQRDQQRFLIRIAVNNERLVIDRKRQTPGRGAWVHTDPKCVSQAQRRRAFPRILKIDASRLDDETMKDFWEELATIVMSEAQNVPKCE